MPDYSIDFSPIGDLANIYRQAQQRTQLQGIGDELVNGNNDYKALAARAFKAGNMDLGLQFLKQHDEREASAQFDKFLTTYGGGNSTPTPTVTPGGPLPSAGGQVVPGAVAPPVTQPRPAVPSSAKVWGDKEAEDAGLYEPRSVKTIPITNPANDLSLANLTEQYRQEGSPLPRPRPADAPAAQDFPAQPAAAPQAMPALATANSLPGGAPTINPAAGNIQALAMAAGNSRLPKGKQELAKVMLTKALEDSKTPDEIKKYGFYAQQESEGGRTPLSFNEWELQLKRAGSTLINTAEGLDAAQTRARIDVDKHAIQDLSKKTVSGRAAIPLLDTFMRIADKTPEGWAGAVSPTIAKALSSVGIEVPQGISNAELMVAISRQFIPAVRDPGATSNYEQSLYTAAVPGLVQSADGRMKIARMFRATVERNAQIMQIYRQNIGSPDLDKKLADLDNKPMFAPEDRKTLERFAETSQPQQPAGGQVQEGATATNKQTGQKIIFKGGQWQPVQ